VWFSPFIAKSLKNYIFRNIRSCSPFKSTDISEEHVASTFRIEEQAKQETTIKQVPELEPDFFGV
jgi:hypothetical protein